MAYERQLEPWKETMREQARLSHAYANVVIGVGYAGFFALWALVRADLPAKSQAWAAMLMGISLLFYIGWEVFQMTAAALAARDIEEQLQRTHTVPDVQQLTSILKSRQAALEMYWPPVLAATLVSATLGACILFYGLGVMLWPHL